MAAVIDLDDDSCSIEEVETHEPWPKRKLGQQAVLIGEIFSPPRVIPAFTAMMPPTLPLVIKGLSLDLMTGWNAEGMGDRQALLQWVGEQCPEVIIASPPCTMFSTMQNLNKKVQKDLWDSRYEKGLRMLQLAMQVCQAQVNHGKGFVYEHPARASSWKVACVRDVEQSSSTVQKVVFDQCQFGLRDPKGRMLKKSTIIMTNMDAVVRKFQGKKCSRECRLREKHACIQGTVNGVQVSAHAQVYPPAMVQALAEAMAEHYHLV